MFGPETRELVHAIAKVTRLVMEKAEGGLERDEALEIVGKLVMDAEFRDAIVSAVMGAGAIPGELGSLKLSEVLAKIEEVTSPL